MFIILHILGGAFNLRRNNIVDSCSFVNNSASSGRAFYCRGGEIANSSFTNTHVSQYGGDMYIEIYTFVSNCVFNHNWADDGWINDGGDIFSREATIDNCTFDGSNFVIDEDEAIFTFGKDIFISLRLSIIL